MSSENPTDNAGESFDQMFDRTDAPATPKAEPAAPAPATPSATPAAAPAANGTPAVTPAQQQAAAERRLLKYKFDREEVEEDLDELWRNEETRKQLVEARQLHRAYPRIQERLRATGQQDVLDLLTQAGYSVTLNPKTKQYEVVAPKPAPASDATPASPAPDVAELKRKALEGDAQALVAFTEYQAEAARQAAEKRVQDAEEQRKTAAQESATRHAAETFLGKLRQRVEARAKSFDGPRADTLRTHALRVAISAAQFNPQLGEEAILAVVDEFADGLDVTKAEYAKGLATNATTTQKPPPAMSGAPVAAGQKKGSEFSNLDDLLDDTYGAASRGR